MILSRPRVIPLDFFHMFSFLLKETGAHARSFHGSFPRIRTHALFMADLKMFTALIHPYLKKPFVQFERHLKYNAWESYCTIMCTKWIDTRRIVSISPFVLV